MRESEKEKSRECLQLLIPNDSSPAESHQIKMHIP
ncbi:hypothetical protein EcE24377A_4819 [Escherichia coli O139:H28 str. E24377A]|uniref:Uncharacterized protein n=1 Tax=Escherichia coli O139:H28 (strain E24377A / ETEC) TaxID=331111 RepID=A7ZVC8_ECO24|nr:hypothetical protein EcE24377A_4819 [Escherichia coli O139:H28 str. E24377A]